MDWTLKSDRMISSIAKKIGLIKTRNPFTPVSIRSPTGGMQFKYISLKPSSGDRVMIKNSHSGNSIHPIPTHHMSYKVCH